MMVGQGELLADHAPGTAEPIKRKTRQRQVQEISLRRELYLCVRAGVILGQHSYPMNRAFMAQ